MVQLAFTKIAIGTFLLIALFPKQIRFVDFRANSKALVVQARRTSPAMAAFEDAKAVWETRRSSIAFSNHSAKFVKTGQRFVWTVPVKSRPAPATPTFRPTVVVHNNLSSPLVPALRLKGLVIRQEQQVLTIAQNNSLPERSQQREIAYPETEGPNGELLPLAVRKQRLASYYSQRDWSGTSLRQRAQELVQRELAGGDTTQTYFVTTRAGGSAPITIGGQPNSAPTKNQKANYAPELPPPKPTHTAAISETETPAAPEAPAYGIMSVQNSPESTYRLRGQIEFRDGLAYTGSGEVFVLQHVIAGQPERMGRVDLQEGRFEIYARGLKGHVEAKMVDHFGVTIGYGDIDLYSLADGPYFADRLDTLKIVMKPVTPGAEIEVTSGRSYTERKIPLKIAQVQISSLDSDMYQAKDGFLGESRLQDRSSYMLRADAKNHWGSLAIGVSGARREVRLFPTTMVEALVNISTNRRPDKGTGIVWGRVTLNGRPVAGAKVELAGDQLIDPIYFNSYIPDKKLTTTTSNGLFAFVNVVPGIQVVRAVYNGQYVPAEIIPAEADHVSYVDLAVVDNNSATLKIVDGLSPQRSLNAAINVVGSADSEFSVRADQEQVFKFPGGAGVMLLDVDAGAPYEVVRMTVDRRSHHIEIPLVQSEWLNSITTQRKINIAPDTGVIVGFGQPTDFEVYLGGIGNGFVRKNLVYFDAQGILRPPGYSGGAGGGFAIFNVPTGFTSIAIVPTRGLRIQTHVLVSEPRLINVIR